MEAAEDSVEVPAAAACPESAPASPSFHSGGAVHPDPFETAAGATTLLDVPAPCPLTVPGNVPVENLSSPPAVVPASTTPCAWSREGDILAPLADVSPASTRGVPAATGLARMTTNTGGFHDFLAEMRSGGRGQARASVGAAPAPAPTAGGEQTEFSGEMSRYSTTVCRQPSYVDDSSGSRSGNLELSDDEQSGENQTTESSYIGLTLPSIQQKPPVLGASNKGDCGETDGVVVGRTGEHQELNQQGQAKQGPWCGELSDGSVGNLLVWDTENGAMEEEKVKHTTAKKSSSNSSECGDSKEAAAAAAAVVISGERAVLGSTTAASRHCAAPQLEEGVPGAIVEEQPGSRSQEQLIMGNIMVSAGSLSAESEDAGGPSPSVDETPQAAAGEWVMYLDEMTRVHYWNNGQESVGVIAFSFLRLFMSFSF